MHAAVLTAILFALTAVCAAQASSLLGADRANAWRLAIALGILAVWVHGFGPGLQHGLKPWFLAAGAVGFGLGGWCAMQALRHGGSTLSLLVIECVAALAATAIGWLVLGAALHGPHLAWMAVILTGVVLGASPGPLPALPRPLLRRACAFAIAAGCLQAVSINLSKHGFNLLESAAHPVTPAEAAYQRLWGGFAAALLIHGVMRWRTRGRFAPPGPQGSVSRLAPSRPRMGGAQRLVRTGPRRHLPDVGRQSGPQSRPGPDRRRDRHSPEHPGSPVVRGSAPGPHLLPGRHSRPRRRGRPVVGLTRKFDGPRMQAALEITRPFLSRPRQESELPAVLYGMPLIPRCRLESSVNPKGQYRVSQVDAPHRPGIMRPMTGKCGLTREHVARILGSESLENAARRLRPDMDALPHVPAGSAKVSAQRARALWDDIGGDPALREILLERAPDELALYQGNIENAIGLLRMPIGLAGPLRVNGMAAKGDYPIPLATTEAALVASYHRGCRLLTAAGGCTAMVLYESLSRAPGFVFETAADACRFIAWAVERFE